MADGQVVEQHGLGELVQQLLLHPQRCWHCGQAGEPNPQPPLLAWPLAGSGASARCRSHKSPLGNPRIELELTAGGAQEARPAHLEEPRCGFAAAASCGRQNALKCRGSQLHSRKGSKGSPGRSGATPGVLSKLSTLRSLRVTCLL